MGPNLQNSLSVVRCARKTALEKLNQKNLKYENFIESSTLYHIVEKQFLTVSLVDL